uniref:GDNF/GAS1 domain-containing protein n=1 Tax=Amphilophus citrinellus TaxID=61819 RepID=A0A3Q0SKA9_AMPCI
MSVLTSKSSIITLNLIYQPISGYNQPSQGKLSQQQTHRKHLLLKQDLARLWKILFFCLPLCFIQDGGCQITGSEVCNITIPAILYQFPSLRGCVCAWEGELCDSMQVLATQCDQNPEYDSTGSCVDQVGVCVSDSVCNRYLAPVLQACKSEHCNSKHCQRVTQQFYGNMPQKVAEMLVMCECDALDQNCLHIKTGLHSGACGDDTWICQHVLNQCTEDSNCRGLLKSFQANCWSAEETQCIDSDLPRDECFTQMDPELILGADSECKKAFLATLGTVLHHPCTCEGLYNDDLLTCSMIHNALHNRSRFVINKVRKVMCELTKEISLSSKNQSFFFFCC